MNNKITWKQEDIKQLINLIVNEKLPYLAISKIMNRTKGAVSRKASLLKKRNVLPNINHNSRTWTNEELEIINNGIRNKLTINEIAKIVNSDYNQLNHLLNCQCQIINKENRYKKWNEEDLKTLRILTKNGHSLREISIIMKRTRTQIISKTNKLKLKSNFHKRKMTSCGDIRGWVFENIKRNAEIRGIPFSITIEEIWDLFLKQNKKCAYTGKILTFGTKSQDTTASLDRINSKIAYISGNIQWIHKRLNKIKNNLHEDEFLYWIEKIYKYRFKN